jgi:metallo-beta-lactamase class B
VKEINPMRISKFLVVAFLALGACLLSAQETKPDSPQVVAQIEKAKKIAGTQWAAEAEFFCTSPRANQANDPLLEPMKLFDNLYVIGRVGTAVYALTTPQGIVLIDSGYADQVDSVLLAGMKKLGMDPANAKYIVVTHGHGDHFGGAAYFQERYGAKIVLSAADWDLMARPPAAPANQGKAAPPPVPTPTRDVVADEGKPIVLGDLKITPVMIPGHTPGSIGLIFPVKDGGQNHMAALFGGTILLAGRIPDDGLQQYLRSIEHFKSEAARMKVDVEVQNHPLMDGITEKLAKLQQRKGKEPNPFVVGQAGYAAFLDVMSECMKAEVMRRASR